jgi:hypothetical protein
MGRCREAFAFPSEIAVIEKIPVLGSGKVDNVAVTKLAHQQFSRKNAVVA